MALTKIGAGLFKDTLKTNVSGALGDNLFKKVEKILPNKIKRCQRIVGMFLDYKNRKIIEESLSNDELFNELVEGAIICIEKNRKKKT